MFPGTVLLERSGEGVKEICSRPCMYNILFLCHMIPKPDTLPIIYHGTGVSPVIIHRFSIYSDGPV